jgi:hypothetical protein
MTVRIQVGIWCLIDLHSSHEPSNSGQAPVHFGNNAAVTFRKTNNQSILTSIHHETMASHLRLETRTFANCLVTSKSFFPLQHQPTIASIPRYPENWVSKSLFFKTEVQPFAAKQAIRNGSHKTLHTGKSTCSCAYFFVCWVGGIGCLLGMEADGRDECSI